MATGLNISFGLVDVSAKRDTTAVMPDKQPFIDPQDLKLEGVYALPAATLEQDYWRLDKGFECFPNAPENSTWGIWSLSMAREDSRFQIPPVLTISFRENHTSIGLSFEFNPHGPDWCNDLNIQWFNNQTRLSSMDFSPSHWRYACMNQVKNYNKIIITFRGMNRPYRFLKVQNIMHGTIKFFGSGEIQQANLLEEIDATGATLSINNLDFAVYSKDSDFNIFNPKGVYQLLQKKQQLSVDGDFHGKTLNLGTFYIEGWEDQTEHIFKISANDAIGVMDGTYFPGGIYVNVAAGVLLAEIMDHGGFGYTLDSKLAQERVAGWLPRCTHREALQQLAFAIGGYVDTARGGTVNIRRLPDPLTTAAEPLGKGRKLLGTKVKLKPYVSGVSVTEHHYVLQAEAEELFNGTLEVGFHEILFSTPAMDLLVTGATLTESKVNHCRIKVATAGNVVVSGKLYKDSTRIVVKKAEQILAGEKENILEVKEATLVSDGATVAERLFRYYQQRIQQNINFVLGNESPGRLVAVEVAEGEMRYAVVEKLDTDLTGGFVTKAVVVGV